jgi:isoquinoline 1-oxidoreductase beta subunit
MKTKRRDFLKVVAGSGGALVIGTLLPPLASLRSRSVNGQAQAAEPPVLHADPEAFIRIASDNTVTLISKHLEMGQGITTGLATLVAEELGADWSQMRCEFAPADSPRYANLFFNMQGTGGSTSMANSFTQMRLAGAACRQMLISAAATSWKLPAREIDIQHGVLRHTPSGRHAPIGTLAAAAAKLPVPANVVLKSRTNFKIVGKEGPQRIDGVAKTTGRAVFGLDVRRPGMVRAVIARPPRFGGKLKSFDATDAKAIKGVIAVLPVPAGIAVIARNTWAAIQARSALKIEWDDSAAEMRSSAEIRASLQQLVGTPGALPVTARGDAAKAMAGAARVIEADYSVPFLAHAPMEPLNAVIEIKGDRADVWAGFQIPTLDQSMVAAVLNLKPAQVRLHTVMAGGSFGRRTVSDYLIEAATVAKALGGTAPLQLVWTRSDDLQSGYYRPAFHHHLRAGLDNAGKLLAWEQQIIGPSIALGSPMEGMIHNGIDQTSVDGAVDNFYGIPNLQVNLRTPPSKVKLTAWRSVGNTHTGFAMESFIDELAHATDADPMDFRLTLLTERPDLTRLLTTVAEKSGWRVPLAAGRGRGVAIREAFKTRVALVAEVTVANDGAVTVDRVVCAVDCGTAVSPDGIRSQIEGGIGFGLGAALQGAITLTDGKVDQSNFDGYLPLRINQMPKVEVYVMPSDAPPTGVGELGVPCIAPAVANAVFAAAGRRIRALPIKSQTSIG